jgi:hypothetical protein
MDFRMSLTRILFSSFCLATLLLGCDTTRDNGVAEYDTQAARFATQIDDGSWCEENASDELWLDSCETTLQEFDVVLATPARGGGGGTQLPCAEECLLDMFGCTVDVVLGGPSWPSSFKRDCEAEYDACIDRC